MELKDLISVGLSGLAFALSLTATFVTLRQKKFEMERTLRYQLTDAIGKLNDVFEDATKLELEKAGTLSEPAVLNLRAFYNGQKVFYARQAVYVSEQIPGLVSDAEYNSIARAFLDVDDDETGVRYYEKAIAAADGPMYKATSLRGLGRILIRMGETVRGREAFSESLSLVPGPSESANWFQAETFQRWAQIESAAGNHAEAEKLLEKSALRYSAIHFPPRRIGGLANLDAARKRLSLPIPAYAVTSSQESNRVGGSF